MLAGVVFRRSGTRLGYENNSNFLIYTFSAGYTLKPHRFQLDLAYFRDRFSGAVMQTVGLDTGRNAWTGQRTDSVDLIGSWRGQIGPVLGLVEGILNLGDPAGRDTRDPHRGGPPAVCAGAHV